MGDIAFYGSKLRVARLLNGRTKADLADRLGVSRQFVHSLEIGGKQASKDMVAAISLLLQVHPSFFSTSLVTEVREEECHFRSRASMPQKLAEQVISRGTAIEILVRFLDQKLSMPAVNFPTLEAETEEELERAAEQARVHWGLGHGPIANMCRVLETAGAIVTLFATDRSELDALSMARARPIIVRNVLKQSPGRQRFDLAHECGHLLIHQGINTGDPETERQANRFASAFLMPRALFRAEFPRMPGRVDWQAIYSLKVRWRVSAKAVVRRAKDLDLLNAVQYAAANRYLNQSGQARVEKFDDRLPNEEPELLTAAVSRYNSAFNATAADLAREIGMTRGLLEELVSMRTARGEAA